MLKNLQVPGGILGINPQGSIPGKANGKSITRLHVRVISRMISNDRVNFRVNSTLFSFNVDLMRHLA